MFELQNCLWENGIEVKCNIGNFAAFVHSMQSAPMARSAARVRFRKDSVQAEFPGTPGKVPIQKGARKGDRYFAQFPRARFRGDFQKKSKGACKRES